MKLVNPNYLGFSIDYKFKGIELKCKEFKDAYSSCTYSESGCYACNYLNISQWGDTAECTKGHTARLVTVRKDGSNIVENCTSFTSRRQRYGQSGCAYCNHGYRGSNRTKCRNKFETRDEIVRM